MGRPLLKAEDRQILDYGISGMAAYVGRFKIGTGNITPAATPAADPTKTVTDVFVEADSKIMVWSTSLGTLTTPPILYVKAADISAGSFIVRSYTFTEISTTNVGFGYMVIREVDKS